MTKPEKRASVIELNWAESLWWGVGAVLVLLVALFCLRYGNEFVRYEVQSGKTTTIYRVDFSFLAYPLFLVALVLFAIALKRAFATTKLPSYQVSCPYCGHETEFTDAPQDDFVCDGCSRRVPVREGRVLEVTGVRCGYCGALNYMSDKTEVLICEECDREIPLLNPETGEMRHVPRGFARVDDPSLYELVLVSEGRDREAIMNSLQHMLALNRNQVKEILERLPVTLLSGINRRKAEMLRAQLEASGGTAELRAINPQE